MCPGFLFSQSARVFQGAATHTPLPHTINRAVPLQVDSSRRNHQIDRLRAFALFIRFDIERYALSFG